jgi:hypothetical protein
LNNTSTAMMRGNYNVRHTAPSVASFSAVIFLRAWLGTRIARRAPDHHDGQG